MNTQNNPRAVMVTLTAKEHLYHLAGIHNGTANGIAKARQVIREVKAEIEKGLKEVTSDVGSPQQKVLVKDISNNVSNLLEATLTKLAEMEGVDKVLANQVLDRAHNSSQPVSLRKKVKHAILEGVKAFRKG